MSYLMSSNDYQEMLDGAISVRDKTEKSLKTLDEMLQEAIKDSIKIDSLSGMSTKDLEMLTEFVKAYKDLKEVSKDALKTYKSTVTALVDIHQDIGRMNDKMDEILHELKKKED